MEKLKSWVVIPLLGLVNLVAGYFMTKLLDSLVGDEFNSLNDVTVSSVHWIRYVPAILASIIISISLFYLCKNLRAALYTKCLVYVASSLAVIGVFLSGSWYKDPIYTLILEEDDYYTAEKTNFESSNGTIVAWSDGCTQSGRIVYCNLHLKNLSDKDQNVSLSVYDTYLMTGEKARVKAQRKGKFGNSSMRDMRDSVIAPTNMTIMYGLKFELPEPTKYEIIPNLRVVMNIAGYRDTFSMSNRPIKTVSGH
ncbi:hypothetical protein EK599_13570 [Vibrio sp. T187]|uniref:hypothetical protein n=1 Tax=Vibrio TaxID=662 RepID=UPI0010CA05CD|nr:MULTISPECIES: hypothetical protein [Vibrio]MBW3696728.1 hypothetical protein [Vibrio sp. T187]